MRAIEELTRAVKALNKKADRLPDQGWEPHPAKEGKFSDKEGLNMEEVAEYLGVGKSTVQKYQDIIPHTYIGGRLIFPKTAVKDWLKENAMKRIEKDRREVEGAIIRELTS